VATPLFEIQLLNQGLLVPLADPALPFDHSIIALGKQTCAEVFVTALEICSLGIQLDLLDFLGRGSPYSRIFWYSPDFSQDVLISL
jgi:hypothetical protein